MKLSATEKRIYALAKKWAKHEPSWSVSSGVFSKRFHQSAGINKCGRALLKLFKERA